MAMFQSKIKSTLSVILDEFSIMSSHQFFWVNKRLQEGMKNDKPFGGIPIIIFGDPGQLPPVGGSSLWLNKTVSNRQLKTIALAGHKYYSKIRNVLFLTEVRRQSGIFRDILLRLRDGELTESDWTLMLQNCCFELMTTERKDTFMSKDCLHIRASNEACQKVNNERLLLNKAPIVCIEATHESCHVNDFNDENFRELRAKVYTAVGSRMMLTRSINAGQLTCRPKTVHKLF